MKISIESVTPKLWGGTITHYNVQVKGHNKPFLMEKEFLSSAFQGSSFKVVPKKGLQRRDRIEPVKLKTR